MKRTFQYLLLAALALAISGCGYGIKKSPVKAVRIGDIENQTTEAKLEDRFAEALVASFMKNGIQVSGGSDHAVEGRLKKVALDGIAEVDDLTTIYRITIEGEFFLAGADGEKRKLPGGGKFIVTFSSEGALTPIMANKELAIEQALRDMAEEISAAVLYME